jgi:hypothetical protein
MEHGLLVSFWRYLDKGQRYVIRTNKKWDEQHLRV